MQQRTQKAIIIFSGSNRPDNSSSLVTEIAQQFSVKVIDLSSFGINPHTVDDHLIAIIEDMLDADSIIFATPVYWHSMSTRMKLFIDRLTELVKDDRELGEILRGKRGLLLGTGTDAILSRSFEETFSLMLSCIGIEYSGMLYCKGNSDPADHQDAILAFGHKAVTQTSSWATATWGTEQNLASSLP
jgi:hypothetical protein